MTSLLPIDRIEARQRKAQTYVQARREQLAPLEAQRSSLIKAIERQLEQFALGALPSLDADRLVPFDAAARENFLEFSASRMAEKLRQQSAFARKLCQRYEREFDIYHMAEYLPDAEKKLAAFRARQDDVQRTLDRLEMRLDALAGLNQRLIGYGLPAIGHDTAADYSSTGWLQHIVRFIRNRGYRMASPVVAGIEAGGGKLAAVLEARSRLQQELIVREQETELCQSEVERQRGWVEAYVMAWTSRLSEKQIAHEIRQAICDEMQDSGFRQSVAVRFERRYPVALDELFRKLDIVNSRIRRFLMAFDAKYEAGRVEVAEELASRQRLPGTI